MSVSIVYSSKTGNTKMLAETIFNLIDKKRLTYFGILDYDLTALRGDTIFVGFNTIKGDCPEEIKDFLGKVKDKKVALFGTAGYSGNKDYHIKILRNVYSHLDPSVTVIGAYMCQGKMAPEVRERYLSMKAQHPEDERIDVMIQNFDNALTHPDDTDLRNLMLWLKTLKL